MKNQTLANPGSTLTMLGAVAIMNHDPDTGVVRIPGESLQFTEGPVWHETGFTGFGLECKTSGNQMQGLITSKT